MTIQPIGSEDAPLSWEDFLKEVKNDVSAVRAERENAKNKASHSNWIYRGHADSKWELKTTLERYYIDELDTDEKYYDLQDYYLTSLEYTVPFINTFLAKNFERVKSKEFKLSFFDSLPCYDLLCYARHLGFPSPLLDWSRSYYVAAFFAFSRLKKGNNVAIYAYQNWQGQARGGDIEDPIIDELGPHVETHPRHFKQQAVYTICKAGEANIDDEDKVKVMAHELAIRKNPENHKMKKFILDGSEKEKVLEELYLMNINDYTLFGDEESLMRTLAYRAFRRLF